MRCHFSDLNSGRYLLLFTFLLRWLFLCLLCFSVYISPVHAATIYWKGQVGKDQIWSDSDNWDLGRAVQSGDVVYYDNSRDGGYNQSQDNDISGLTNLSFVIEDISDDYSGIRTGNAIGLASGNAINMVDAEESFLFEVPITLSGATTVLGSPAMWACSFTKQVDNQGYDLTLSNGNPTVMTNGELSGTGGLIIENGAEFWIKDTNQTYTGNTTVNTGAITLMSGGGLPDKSALILSVNGMFGLIDELNESHDDTIGSLSGAGYVELGDSVLTTGGDNTDTTFSGVIDDTTYTGSLIKTGSGKMILSGINTYSGNTTIEQGILSIGADNNLGDASANLVFDGGTLQTTSSFTSGRTVTLNAGDGTFDTNGNDNILSGNISGAGSLIKIGSGTLTLSGINTYSGGATTVSGGTLKLGAGSSLPDDTALNLAASGIFDLDNNNDTVGSLAGEGNVTLGSAVFTTGGNNTDTIFSGVISGTGSLDKRGTGTLTLSGANTFSGDITITTGALSVTGSLNGDTVISSGASLSGTGGMKKITNSGRIAPGNSIGTLTVNGDYIHNSGATYEAEVDDQGNSDLIDVSGAAVLNGGSVEVQIPDGIYADSIDYTILQATGGVNGTFDTVTSDNSQWFETQLSYNANDVALNIIRVPFASVAETPIESAVGTALDNAYADASGDMRDVLNSLQNLNASEACQAYNRIGGASHQAYSAASFTSTNLYIDTIFWRAGSTHAGSSSFGFVDKQSAAFSGPKTTPSNSLQDMSDHIYLTLGNVLQSRSMLPWGAWALGYGEIGSEDNSDIARSYDYSIYGFAAGMDYRISDELQLGVSSGYGNTDIEFESLNDSGKTHSFQASIYESYIRGAWFLDSVLAFIRHNYDTTRGVVVDNIDRVASAEYSGNEYAAYLETGYGFEIHNVMMVPIVSLQVSYLDQGDYTETGAGALNLTMEDQSTTSVVGSIGARFLKELKYENSITFTPEFRARWFHEFNNATRDINARFTGSSDGSFVITTSELIENKFMLGMGLNTRFGQTWDFECNYDSTLAEDFLAHAVNFKVTFSW